MKPRQRAERAGLRGGRRRRYTLAERMAARTIVGPDCWIFQGAATGSNGYVKIMRDPESRQLVSAHRVAYELAYGPIPAGKVVMHECDQPKCVRPDHLRLGTQAENIHDSIHKGRYNTFGKQKLNAAQVLEIRALWAAGWPQKDIARKFGIKRHSVSGIVTFKSWQHLGPFVSGDAVANVERVPHVQLPVRGDLHV